MKNISLVTIFLISFLSCINDEKKVVTSKKEGKKSKIFENKKIIIPKQTLKLEKEIIKEEIKPKIYNFKHSKCNEGCNDSEQIISKYYWKNKLLLKIGLIRNCVNKFKAEMIIENDVLYLEINENVDYIVDCNCYFYFDISIDNLKKTFNKIIINGNDLNSKLEDEKKNIIDSIIIN